MTNNSTLGDHHGPSDMTRRTFVAGTTALGLATIVRPERVAGAEANSKIAVGLVGCGGRGNWIADLFNQHGGYQFVGTADYFKDRAEGTGNRLKVPAAKCFSGLAGYKRLLDARPDAIIIESPPYFHPEQSLTGVEAGVHVYCAKPVAVDVPGCLAIAEAGRKGTEKKRCVLIDFQTRATEFFIEAIKRVHAGAIGRLAFGESTYHADIPWMGQIADAKGGENPERRLRAWGLDRILSGDIIVEQNIHTLDVASWIMNQPPVSAYGTGGQKVRDFGTCWDTFSVVYQYPNQVAVNFSSRQFNGYGTTPEGIRNRMFGADGVLETEYGGQVLIRGKSFYRGGRTPGIYQEGAMKNIADFHAAIGKGDYSNPTVAPSVRSNLTAILGRMAAYKKAEVTWSEMMKTAEKLDFSTAGLKT
jgi:myo-inositol 2-dehydrogenase / D-chiro-inositol 1-dehydrogenase